MTQSGVVCDQLWLSMPCHDAKHPGFHTGCCSGSTTPRGSVGNCGPIEIHWQSLALRWQYWNLLKPCWNQRPCSIYCAPCPICLIVLQSSHSVFLLCFFLAAFVLILTFAMDLTSNNLRHRLPFGCPIKAMKSVGQLRGLCHNSQPSNLAAEGNEKRESHESHENHEGHEGGCWEFPWLLKFWEGTQRVYGTRVSHHWRVGGKCQSPANFGSRFWHPPTRNFTRDFINCGGWRVDVCCAGTHWHCSGYNWPGGVWLGHHRGHFHLDPLHHLLCLPS